MYRILLDLEEKIDKMGNNSASEAELFKLLEDSYLLAGTLKKHAKGVVEHHYLRVLEANYLLTKK